jgi:anti-sigma regulatory factor (Ser/Thr protein kinase)
MSQADRSHDAPGVTGTRYRVELGSDPAEIPAVRRAVKSYAQSLGFDERASDLALALDELIANSQEHGRAPILVEAWWDGRLVVEVSDTGDGLDRQRVWRSHPPEPFGRRGRGLWIVRQLMDVVIIESGPEGTHVQIELSEDPHIGA